MVRPSVLPAALLLATVAVPVRAEAPATELAFRRYVESLVAGGKLDWDEALLARFQRVFAPDELPPELRTPAVAPVKSATGLVMEYRSIREGLPPTIAALIEEYLSGGASAQTFSHATPHFVFTYELDGPNAVDPVDADVDGVPDFVERIGAWGETAWSRFFEDAGFAAPSGRVPVSFREMEAFGYTLPEGVGTRIVLHRSYEGFPPNHDPEGSVRGAAKVTVAHELKHASQFEASAWSEGGWLEADATWAEDFVFDATDDYLRYLPEGSPVSHPDAWLADGASYEDCLWQHLLEQRHGVEALVAFFVRRAEHPGEAVPASFDQTLRARGSSLAAEGAELAVWSYFCGGNAAARPVGFEEAAAYPTPPFGGYLAQPGETVSATLPGLGTSYVFAGAEERYGRPIIALSAEQSASFALHAMTIDADGVRRVFAVPTSGIEPAEIAVDWAEVPFLVVAVTHVGTGRAGYFLSVDDAHAVGVDVAGPAVPFALEPNRPNPFRSSTEISFSLPAEAPVRLSVYDVAGRLVQRLVEGERLAAGRHDRRWDGLDQSGRLAAPGVYYYRLEAGERSATRSLLLLR